MVGEYHNPKGFTYPNNRMPPTTQQPNPIPNPNPNQSPHLMSQPPPPPSLSAIQNQQPYPTTSKMSSFQQPRQQPLIPPPPPPASASASASASTLAPLVPPSSSQSQTTNTRYPNPQQPNNRYPTPTLQPQPLQNYSNFVPPNAPTSITNPAVMRPPPPQQSTATTPALTNNLISYQNPQNPQQHLHPQHASNPPQNPRPLPSPTDPSNGVSNMSLSHAPYGHPQPHPHTHPHTHPQLNGNSLGPPGMINVPVTDPKTLPRPELSASSMSKRILYSDLPPTPPHYDTAKTQQNDPTQPHLQPQLSTAIPKKVEPATCSSDIFKPADINCVRLTTSTFPTSKSLAFKYSLPIGAIVKPLAQTEEPIPIVNFGTSGIVRCRHCRSYINFTSIFLDGGRRWKCSLCQSSNECPADYFSPLDQYGKRRDAPERPELHRGSMEFIAPAEYMVRPPMPPVYLFLLETSTMAIQSGLLQSAINGIRNSIDSLPNEGRTRIGIITFDSTIQYYLLKPSSNNGDQNDGQNNDDDDIQPRVYVIADIEDIFLPTPEDILAQLTDCRKCFENTLTLIEHTFINNNYSNFNNNTNNNNGMIASGASCLGSALQSSQRAMELVGGKLLVFITSRPTIGPGKLRERGEGNGILGTDRERAVLRTETSFYRDLAVSMSKYQISTDLFVCSCSIGTNKQKYVDLATISQIAKYTGGEIFYSYNFDVRNDGPRLQLSINRVLARENGLEAVMRIRATKGIRCTKFSGRFFVRSTDLLAMPNVDSDKSYSVQFNIEDVTLNENKNFCLQVALLYTTTSGERRIRVHTLSVPLVNNLHDLLSSIDISATSNIFMRMAAEAIKDRNLEDLRKLMTDKLSNCLIKYKENIKTQYPGLMNNQHQNQGQQGSIFMTEAMQLLPLMIHGIGRSVVLNRDVSGAFIQGFDDKSAMIHDIDVMSINETGALIYPNILQIIPQISTASSSTTATSKHADDNNDNNNNNKDQLVKDVSGVKASFESLKNDCALLIDNGRSIIVWVGSSLIAGFLGELFGKEQMQQIQQSQQLPDAKFLGVELMRRSGMYMKTNPKGIVGQIYKTVSTVVSARKPFLPVFIALQGEQSMQAKIESLMVEERTASIASYRDFMMDLQRKVTQVSS